MSGTVLCIDVKFEDANERARYRGRMAGVNHFKRLSPLKRSGRSGLKNRFRSFLVCCKTFMCLY